MWHHESGIKHTLKNVVHIINSTGIKIGNVRVVEFLQKTDELLAFVVDFIPKKERVWGHTKPHTVPVGYAFKGGN